MTKEKMNSDLEKNIAQEKIDEISNEQTDKQDRGSASMFDIEDSSWGGSDYFGDTPYPHFG